jgi:hypothetical protein
MKSYSITINRLPSAVLSPNVSSHWGSASSAKKADKTVVIGGWMEKYGRIPTPFEKTTGPGFDPDNSMARCKYFIDALTFVGAIKDDNWKTLSLSFDVVVDKNMPEEIVRLARIQRKVPGMTILTLTNGAPQKKDSPLASSVDSVSSGKARG